MEKMNPIYGEGMGTSQGRKQDESLYDREWVRINRASYFMTLGGIKLIKQLSKHYWHNRRAHNRHQCRQTTVLSCHRYLNIGAEKNELHPNIDLNFDHHSK